MISKPTPPKRSRFKGKCVIIEVLVVELIFLFVLTAGSFMIYCYF